MKICLPAVAVIAVTAFATAAAAAGPVTAKLEAPVDKQTKQVAGGAAFLCVADTCTAATPASSTLTVMACRQLVRAVGPVSAYGSQTKQLSPEKLAECNAWTAKEVARAP